MAFNKQCLGVIGTSGNLATRILQDGSISGAPQIYSYISITDTAAQIAAADYFVELAPVLNYGDLFHAIGSDTGITLTVAAVSINPPSVITVQAISTGDVDGPPSSTNRSIATWNGTGGNLLRDNPNATVDSLGNVIVSGGAGVITDELTVGTLVFPTSGAGILQNAPMLYDTTATGPIFSTLRALTQLITSGQILMGQNAGNPIPATIVGGTGVNVVVGSNTITINAIGGGTSTIEVTGTSATMVVGTNYIANNSGVVSLTMPATAAIGDIIRVHGKGAGGWTINCNGGQTIKVGSASTTSGGFVSSSGQYDVVEITCITANTLFSLNGLQTLGLTVG
jgi:hypothetical protein